MSTNETNAETTLHQQEMQQRRENILDLLDIMDEGNLTALRFKDGSMEIELERTPAPGSISSSALPLMAERVGQLLTPARTLQALPPALLLPRLPPRTTRSAWSAAPWWARSTPAPAPTRTRS